MHVCFVKTTKHWYLFFWIHKKMSYKNKPSYFASTFSKNNFCTKKYNFNLFLVQIYQLNLQHLINIGDTETGIKVSECLYSKLLSCSILILDISIWLTFIFYVVKFGLSLRKAVMNLDITELEKANQEIS